MRHKAFSVIVAVTIAFGILLSLTGCMSAYYMAGGGDETLIKTASFDNDCPPDKISIISRDEGLGSANILLDVCGKKIKYKRTGTIYHRADKSVM